MITLLVLAAATATAPTCLAAKAKPVTFRYIAAHAAAPPGECVKVTGFLFGTSLFVSKAAALRKGEPNWRMIGLDGNVPETKMPKRVTVYGRVEDCGSAMRPSYCHYVGGSVIREAHIL
jgi:hypothetical protein